MHFVRFTHCAGRVFNAPLAKALGARNRSMKNGIIVLACLIPLVLVLAYGIYEKNDCMSEQDAQPLYQSALEKESVGEYKEAYRLCKQIDAYACENFELRAKAFEKAVGLKIKMEVHSEDT